MNFYGCHLSIKNGIKNTLMEIMKLKGNIVQIFISNPQSSKNINFDNKYPSEYISDLNYFVKKNNLKIVIHLPYIFNLANINLNIEPIISQLIFSSKIKSIGCVIHVGKYLYLKEYEAEDVMFNNLKKIINIMQNMKLKTFLILETSAGQGTETLTTNNNSIHKLSKFYNRFSNNDKKYLRLCVDSCHIYSAGFDIRGKQNVSNFFNLFNKEIGISYIALIHLNDSKGKYNCKVDRHANLGYGTIGLTGLKNFIKYALFYHIPIVLETPDEDKYSNELNLIRKINKKLLK